MAMFSEIVLIGCLAERKDLATVWNFVSPLGH
jgi:hypothetical protein